ncbi:hypothetical protein [Flavobacterium urocaniciphilum]|uniref:NlpE N-terminal domain-containing protein n=1 Tax=Flavobacterium urocaniciphilum TaxID=1299341 RepID=A0A1H8YUE7_9FLAO|nr:hypothetical protein [Flavobacterium urocaniciphilum]SEP55727.1 hypothetical protein SAMN05444005_101232 [Flavobacterium urocaniciphilum]
MSKIKNGIIFIVLLITICITNISCSKKVITGKYRTNFNIYGMFSETLTLDCEGNVIMNFSGDLQNNNSIGSWKREKDTLIMFFDTIINKKNKFKGEYKLLIKKNKLKKIPITKAYYKEIIKIYKSKNYDYKHIRNYRKLNRTPKNHYGKTGVLYYKKIENTDCKK